MEKSFCLKGDIAFTPECGKLVTYPNSYLVCENGKVSGIFAELPEKYNGLKILDHTGKLICPGLIDLHIHAPQYAYRGLGMDLELLEWLDTITFPQESKYADLSYAKAAYDIFVSDLKASATTRASIFGTIHVEATKYLMSELDKAGLGAYVGKVNMDRNSPDILIENTADSIRATYSWLEETEGSYGLVKPILTPRFVPSCTDKLMKALGRLAEEKHIPVQSHLSENLSEIDWVKELAPESKGYADAYDRFGLFGSNSSTIMAHCVHMRDDETELMKNRGIFIAHSPQSNTNLRSGIAPIRSFINKGLKVGLASDVAGGSSLNMFKAVADAIQVSKLRWRLVDDGDEALKFCESFYLATKGGGEFFGKVGSFEEGYDLDAIVIDDSLSRTCMELTISERLERMMYLGHSEYIVGKFVAGKQIV